MMLRLLLMISIFFFACFGGNGNLVVKRIPAVVIPANYQNIAKGKMAEVYAEKTLYIGEHDSTYFIHFIIYNVSSDTICISLSDYFNTAYANSWVFVDTTSNVINDGGMRLDYQALTKKEKDELKKDFAENKFRKISPGDSLVYFDNFWPVSDVIKQGNENQPNCPYFTISLRGRLSFTDTHGNLIEDFYSGQDVRLSNFAELNIRWPVIAKPIPAGAILSKR